MNEAVPAATVEDFLAAGARAGVRRVVLLSGRGVGGAADPYQEPIELALRATGLEWTILRPAWFAQNFSEDLFLEPVLSGELALPAGAGREAFVDAEALADVATAAALPRPAATRPPWGAGRRRAGRGAGRSARGCRGPPWREERRGPSW